jgi:putative DNA primase/helicase
MVQTDRKAAMTTRREMEEDAKERPESPGSEAAIPDAGGEYTVELTTDIDRVMDETWDVLVAQNGQQHPDIMQRGGRLVRFNGTTRGLEEYPIGALQMTMARKMGFFKVGAKGQVMPQKAPAETAKHITERTEHSGAPVVDAVARMPFLGSDMAIHTEPGYHAEDRVWLQPDVEIPPIPSEPHHESVEESVKFLVDEWLGDFCFADEASLAHTLALALLPFVRPAIGEATPLHLCNAPSPKSGKSTLAKAALMPGAGNISLTNLSKWGAELEYKVTSWLLEGKPVIWFDNQAGGSTVDSGLLSALLTEPSYSGRVIRSTRTPDMPIRCTWVMTGNNLSFTDELARRAVLIQFAQPPAGKHYRHNPLPQWTMEHRVEIAYALLTLVQHWAAGVPAYERGGPVEGEEGWESRTMGGRHSPTNLKATFEQWSDIVGGIITAAGVPGFLGNEATMKAMDTSSSDVEAFLRMIAATAPGLWTTGEMARMIELPEALDLREAIPVELAKSAEHSEFKTALEYWLRGNHTKWWGDFRVISVTERSPKKWVIEAKS